MRCLILVIVSFDKPVYYDMLRVWREMYLTNDSVWFIQCKPESEWIGDIVNDLPESLLSHSLLSQNLLSQNLLSQSLLSHSLLSQNLLSQSLELDLANKTLFVKGNECLIPGILHKTVEALSFFLSMDPSIEFVWRTNLSSVLDFAGLQRYIDSISSKARTEGISTKGFYGGYIGKAVNENIFFASGAGFLMSRDVAEYLVMSKASSEGGSKASSEGGSKASSEGGSKASLRWDLIDDVAIGCLLEPKFGIQFIERLWIQNGDEDIRGFFHYRCESYMHLRTVEFMRYIMHKLTTV
jgi:hypothetical protein